ncbi:MAG: hypothetical protein MJH10_12175 [Epibacterium sp.]|nr:hypothetical protein [Epibacterium sp.]NQX74305.1 hypothetical protein [Epibacterium sp.]
MTITVFPNGQVLDLAKSYYAAAEFLTDADANAILIVNLRCQATELFLKSLYLTDTATDVGNGVSLFKPSSGRNQGHGLKGSLDKALQEHRDILLSGMPNLHEELESLEGAFQKSRYLYENRDSLLLGKAEDVSKFLAEELPKLHRLVSSAK